MPNNKSGKLIQGILNLEQNVIGVRFIEFKADYDKLECEERRSTICGLTRMALNGTHLKAHGGRIRCEYGAYALGILEPGESMKAAQSYAVCGLYDSKSLARQVQESMRYIPQRVYGVEMAPLDEMEKADLVVLVGNTLQAMRVFQGYAYHYGNPEHLSFFGNQAACGDLISKPFMNHDINLSLFCAGARTWGRFKENQVGISMPGSMFSQVAHGVEMTIDAVNNEKEKAEIIDRVKPLGVTLEINQRPSYGDLLDQYDKYALEQEKLR